MRGCGSFPDRQFRRAEQVDMRRLMIGFVGVVALLGTGFRRKTEELIGAGAVLAYSTGSNRQPYTIGRSG
jgi:hypothetical protein